MLRVLLTILCLSPVLLHAQTIHGEVIDGDGGALMSGITIENIFTHTVVVTDSTGKFSIDAKTGELVEFHKLSYKVGRLRVPAPPMPPYYRIIMEPGATELEEVVITDRYRNFKRDSLRNFETFKSELIFPKLEGLDVIRHPFSAISKRNQQLWRFQREYAEFEQEKYVDYAFNDKLVANITGLRGDSAQAYMRQYRPSYDMLHAMKDYEFFLYIKETAMAWRRRVNLGPARSISGGGGG